MATRIGVDIGGTFTDLVYYDEATGLTGEGKVETVPKAPEEGVIEAVRRHVPKTEIDVAELFLHGTTVGLNALLERRGAKVGLLTTEGFRDVLEIRRGDRAEMYNLFWRQPESLVPRHRRLGIIERMAGNGQELVALDKASVLAAYKGLIDAGADAIAVCLLHAYANPAHELGVEKILREAGFAGAISLSHRISGEYREYERTSTTVIDAFVRARMSNYLKRLESRLRELGFKGLCLITRSGGGSMTFAEAEERPFETIMSGPVAGAQGSGELARTLGIKSLVTADVGGTSFDTALILDGWPQVLYEGDVDGMPVQTPWVDVRSIGAGGGSLAYVDAGGLMRVGPQSAGAEPGPAAYGKGGTQPTVTDAAAFLGMLGRGVLASGITLDVAKSAMALKTVGVQINRDEEETARGILLIAAASMANAMREVSVEQGLDPREMVLLSFGGGWAADGHAARGRIADGQDHRSTSGWQLFGLGPAGCRYGAVGGPDTGSGPDASQHRRRQQPTCRPIRRSSAAQQRGQARDGTLRPSGPALQGSGALVDAGRAGCGQCDVRFGRPDRRRFFRRVPTDLRAYDERGHRNCCHARQHSRSLAPT